jgi:hypothetical protein
MLASSEHACDQWHSSRKSTPLTGWYCKSRPNTEGTCYQLSGYSHCCVWWALFRFVQDGWNKAASVKSYGERLADAVKVPVAVLKMQGLLYGCSVSVSIMGLEDGVGSNNSVSIMGLEDGVGSHNYKTGWKSAQLRLIQ